MRPKLDMSADERMEGLDDAGEDSSSDSDFEEVEASEEDITALAQLEEELEANPNLYDKHLEVLHQLRYSQDWHLKTRFA